MALPDEIKYKSISNWKVNFNLDKKQVGKGLWKVAENKAAYVTGKITVQYINRDEGMLQNFIVHPPLSKNDELKINFSIKTKLKTVLKNNYLQFLHKKNIVLNYEDLKVWDTNNKPLTASFQKRKKGSNYIQVDAKDAVYPITIDPISTTPAALLESNQANAKLGFSVASAGDVKGKTARLDFKTDKESGICCFDIEKSADGFNFYAIGTLGAKNVSSVQSYSFIDANATGKNQFYRIKIKGIAGQIDYGNMQQLQNNSATEILVFPNRTTDVLLLQLNKLYGKINVQIINSTGQSVKQLQLAASNQTITIPVQNLAAG